MRVTHIPTKENCTDIATKIIPGGMKRNALISKVIYDVADVHGTDDPLTEVSRLLGFPWIRHPKYTSGATILLTVTGRKKQ